MAQVSNVTSFQTGTKTSFVISPIHVLVIHKQTGKVVGKCKTMKAARTRRDRLDVIYGSYAHTLKPVYLDA